MLSKLWPPTPNESTWKIRRNLWLIVFVVLAILNYFMAKSVWGAIASLSFFTLITTGVYWLGYKLTPTDLTQDWYHPRDRKEDDGDFTYNPDYWNEDRL